MYFYNIGYYGYDSGEDWQLMHERKFTKDEFAAQIHEAVIAIIPGERYINGIGNIIRDIVEWLTANKGFKRLEFTAEWEGDTNESMIMPEDQSIDDEIVVLSKILRAAGYTWRDDSRYQHKIEIGRMTEADAVKMWEEG